MANSRARAVGVGLLVVSAAAALALYLWARNPLPIPADVRDEALLAGRDASTFPAADEDYFHDMDGGVSLSPQEIKGRNTWIVWTAGDDRLWDVVGVKALGALDFVKTISSHKSLKNNRGNRWEYLGLVNEPCFEMPTGPDPARHNLWLDHRAAGCPPDPFENEQKYPGVAIGARGKTVERASFY